MKRKQPADPPMTLGNTCDVHGLNVMRLNPKCRQEVRLDVDGYADDIPMPSFAPRWVCQRCGHVGADVRVNCARCNRPRDNPSLFGQADKLIE
jgi:hypothetical protein